MKKNTKYTLVLIMFSLLLTVPVQAQSLKLKKANNYYQQFAYDKAVKAYEALKEKTPGVYRNLAKSYLMLGNINKAEQYYVDLIATNQYQPEDVFDYASVLLMDKKYDEAANWMEKFYKLKPNDLRAKAFMENPLYYRDLLKSDPKMVLTNIDINTKFEDFSPVFYKNNQVVFASSRDNGYVVTKKWDGNLQPFLDLYVADITDGNNLTNVSKFNNVVNKKYHDAPATFNANGDYMIITRNIYNDSKLKDNKLWLYETFLIDNQYWSEPKPIYFNSDNFSNGQATLSPDGNTMYFVSDRPGGYGGTDIYKSVRGLDGRWSEPENLGDKINTEGNEMFPIYDAKGDYLFYSSNGLPGLGGLDIFVSKIKHDGSLTKPINLGAPINSNRDDFSLVYNTDGSGFISSNRPGGKGDDDIYSFKNMPKYNDKIKECYISGIVSDKETKEPLIFAKVYLLNDKGQKIKEFETAADGKYEFGIDCGNAYQIYVLREAYDDSHATIDSKQFETPKIVKNFALKRPLSLGKNEMCDHKITPIYYDLDKFFIRYKDKVSLDKIISLMNKFPEMKLEVSSYTDSRASKPYNVVLSKNRTMSVIKYLTDHGIDKNRLVAKWFGELYPVNACVDGVKCSDEEYQQNRRTEFKILNCQ